MIRQLFRGDSEISFDCTVDFNNANSLFQVGQKTEVVVETIPLWIYLFKTGDAIQFIEFMVTLDIPAHLRVSLSQLLEI